MTSVCVFLVAESMKKDLQIADDLTVFNSSQTRPGLYAIDCQRMHGGSRNYEQRGGNASCMDRSSIIRQRSQWPKSTYT